MSWYRTGTVAVTNGSPTVTGTGTAFVGAVDSGEGFIGPDGKTYEILAVVSATVLTLATNYAGSTASAQAYQIEPIRGRINELNANVSALLTRYANLADNFDAGAFGDGSAAAPSINFASDPDTGMYRAGSNQLGFSAGGTLRFLINGAAIGMTGNLALSGTLAVANNTTITGPAVAAPGFNASLKLTQAGDGGTALLFANAVANLGLITAGVTGTGGGTDDGFLAFATSVNGTLAERVRILTGGNVIIGATSGVSLLTVAGTIEHNAGRTSATVAPDYQITRASSGTGIQTGPNITMADGTTNNTTAIQNSQGNITFWNYGAGAWNERARFTSGGNFGLGTPTPDIFGTGYGRVLGISGAGSSALEINAATGNGAYFDMGVNATPIFRIGASASSTIIGNVTNTPVDFITNNSTRGRLNNDGRLLWATPTPFDVTTTAAANFDSTGFGSALAVRSNSGSPATVVSFYVAGGGARVGWIGTDGTTSITYNTTSDERLKPNIELAGEAGPVLEAIDVVQHDWHANDDHVPFGIIAQALHTVYPMAVYQGDDDPTEVTDPWGVDLAKLVPLLIKGHQEQAALIAELTARIEALEA